MIKTIIINLKNQKKRKEDMEKKIKQTSLTDYFFFEAIDGRTDLHKFDFKIMKDWKDPIHQRPINIGEIGCSLSHYFLWNYIFKNKLEKVLILEDDVIFLDNFDEVLSKILNADLYYDIFFLDRIRLNRLYELGEEELIFDNITKAKYSYNSSSYIITFECIKKLLLCNFLNNIMPIDEFLPIMYEKSYPFKKYSSVFKNYKKIIALGLVNDIVDQEDKDDYKSTIKDSNIYIDYS
jgi:collagen beta-1,O-galactosyltransferase